MLNKAYYRRGVRRAYAELEVLQTSPAKLCDMIEAVVRSETVEELQQNLIPLLRETQETFRQKKAETAAEKAKPSAQNLTGTYEEFYSNWRNKFPLAVETGDRHLAFMSLNCANSMFEEIAAETEIGVYDLMKDYDPKQPERIAAAYVAETDRFLEEYEKAGLTAEHYDGVEVFCEAYLAE